MASASIFWPAVAMAMLTFVVMGLTLRERVGQMRRGKIHPQSISTSGQLAAKLTDSRCADNLRNLFELPVLFYVALVIAFVTAQAGPLFTLLAWLFVVLRFTHSAIHCSYNKVMHRFRAYLGGAAVLLAIWLRLAWGLLG